MDELNRLNKLAVDACVDDVLLETSVVHELPPYRGVVSCAIDGEDAGFLMLLVNTDDMVSAKFFYGGTYERGSLSIWAKLSRASNIIFDVGSHTGVYSLCAAAVAKSSKIVSFEPVPQNVYRQSTNIRLNQFTNIELVTAAVAASTGKVPMHIPNIGSYLTQGAKFSVSKDDEGSQLVQGIGIDESVRINGNLDLIKIDVEGGEPAVLAGMVRTLKTGLPVVMIECTVENMCAPTEKFFKEQEYDLFVISEESGRLKKVDFLEVYRKKDGTLDRDQMNRLAVHKSKLEGVLGDVLVKHWAG